MQCPDALRDLFAYIDSELTPGRRSELQAHFEGCASCRDALKASERVEAAAREDHRAVTAPAGLRERVLLRLQAPASAPAASRRWRSLGLVAAACVVLAFAGFLIGFPQTSEAAPAAVREMVGLHEGAAQGRIELSCKGPDLDAIRTHLKCKCDFVACTHDLTAVGFKIVGAATTSLPSSPGKVCVLAPYADPRGRTVTHFCVVESCITLRPEEARDLGGAVYHTFKYGGCQTVLFRHGGVICAFVFAADPEVERVLVAALGK